MPSVLRKAPYHSFSILYSIICISTTTGLYLGYTLVYRGYHPLRNGDSYQYDLTWVILPTGLPVLVFWDEQRRSTYHFASGVRIRLVRPRCRGNRHEPQPAAQARPIERACSKTVGGRRLGHFSRASLVTGTSRFGVSTSRSLLSRFRCLPSRALRLTLTELPVLQLARAVRPPPRSLRRLVGAAPPGRGRH